MTDDVIELYATVNTKGCPDELIFGYFNDQPIPYNYYNLLNDDNDDDNNTPGTPADDALPDNKGVEYSVIKNDKYINNEIIIDDDDIIASYIYPLQDEILVIERVENEN